MTRRATKKSCKVYLSTAHNMYLIVSLWASRRQNFMLVDLYTDSAFEQYLYMSPEFLVIVLPGFKIVQYKINLLFIGY